MWGGPRILFYLSLCTNVRMFNICSDIKLSFLLHPFTHVMLVFLLDYSSPVCQRTHCNVLPSSRPHKCAVDSSCIQDSHHPVGRIILSSYSVFLFRIPSVSNRSISCKIDFLSWNLGIDDRHLPAVGSFVPSGLI